MKRMLLYWIIGVIAANILLTAKAETQEKLVEFYVLKTHVLKELLKNTNLTELATENVIMKKISLCHGIASIPCYTILDDPYGIKVKFINNNDDVNFDFEKYKSNSEAGYSLNGRIKVTENKYSAINGWENNNEVLIIRSIVFHKTVSKPMTEKIR